MRRSFDFDKKCIGFDVRQKLQDNGRIKPIPKKETEALEYKLSNEYRKIKEDFNRKAKNSRLIAATRPFRKIKSK